MMVTSRASNLMEPATRGRNVSMCSACGVAYLDDAWARLVLSQRLEPLELRRLVRDWPEDYCIEVRSCGRCAAPIAVKCPRPALETGERDA